MAKQTALNSDVENGPFSDVRNILSRNKRGCALMSPRQHSVSVDTILEDRSFSSGTMQRSPSLSMGDQVDFPWLCCLLAE